MIDKHILRISFVLRDNDTRKLRMYNVSYIVEINYITVWTCYVQAVTSMATPLLAVPDILYTTIPQKYIQDASIYIKCSSNLI